MVPILAHLKKTPSWEVVYDKLPEEEPTTDKKDTEGNFKPSQVGGGPLQILLLGLHWYYHEGGN